MGALIFTVRRGERVAEDYAKTYFSTGRKFEARHGYLRFFPTFVVKWYFENYQPRLEKAMRDYEHFVPNPSMGNILEIGCGEGKFMEYCGKENAIGLDVWEPGVKKLQEKGFDAQLADASKPLQFKSGTFDIVYSEQVIEHLTTGRAFVREINRVLKKGGKAIIRTVDIARCGSWFYTDYSHVQPYTKESLYRIMEDNGFEVKEISHGICPPGFIMRRTVNAVLLLPKFIQEFYFRKICSRFSYELCVVAVKK